MKILDVGDRMVATMAGGAADCQFWTRIVAKYCAYAVFHSFFFQTKFSFVLLK